MASRDSDGIILVDYKWADTGDKGNPNGVAPLVGWPLVFSQVGGSKPARFLFNLLFNKLFSLAIDVNKFGCLMPYDAAIDYPVDAIIQGSDLKAYRCLIANGPASAVVSPIGNPLTWSQTPAMELSTASGSEITTACAGIANPPIAGDATPGRIIRSTYLVIEDGTNANTIKVTMNSSWGLNGVSVSAVDNIPKTGSIVGGYSMSVDGTRLYVETSNLPGNVVAIASGVVLLSSDFSNVYPETFHDTNRIRVGIRQGTSQTLTDLTTIASGKFLGLQIAWYSSA